MSVCAVIVTYNRLTLLKECISNLLKQTYKLSNIVIINNNSSDGTASYLNKLHKMDNKIIVKSLNKNLGGAGGFNIGTFIACKYCKSDYVWIMDDDTMPTSSSLKNLLRKAKLLKNNFGFLCSNVRWWQDDEPCNVPHVSSDWTEDVNKSLIKVISSTFVSILIPRMRVNQMGLPIKKMFIWGDDTEYTTRLSRKFNSYFVPDSIVYHKGVHNRIQETIFNASGNRLKFYKYMYRNVLFIDKKYYPFGQFMKDFLAFMFSIVNIPFKSRNKRIKRIYIAISGILKGFIFNPQIQFVKDKRNN